MSTNQHELDPMERRAKDSARMLPYWDKVDDILEGQHAIQAQGCKYLPQHPDEPKEVYNQRLVNIKFTNVFADIVEGLASKPFEEEVTLTESEDPTIDEFIENVDGAGNNLTVFASNTFFNGIANAIDWIFVDYPTTDSTVVRTVAEAKAAGVQPFWSRVLARNVLDARVSMLNGKQVLSYMRIFEPATEETKDRVRIFERTTAGKIIWQLYEKGDTMAPNSTTRYKLLNEGILSIGVIPLVPFATGRRDGKSFYFQPPMAAAADLQITLYQEESGLQNVKVLSAYPMLAANGMKPAMEADGKTPKKLAVGPGRVLYAPADGNGNSTSWAYVEPSAEGMKFLQESIDKTKNDLRELGRQPLTAQSGNITAITSAVAASKARSAVSAWALMLKDALENALQITAMWLNLPDYEPQVNVFNEFDNFTESNNDLNTLDSARARGDLSLKTYWSELKRRKVLAPEFEADDELERILEETPSDGTMDNGLDNPDDLDQNNPSTIIG